MLGARGVPGISQLFFKPALLDPLLKLLEPFANVPSDAFLVHRLIPQYARARLRKMGRNRLCNSRLATYMSTRSQLDAAEMVRRIFSQDCIVTAEPPSASNWCR